MQNGNLNKKSIIRVFEKDPVMWGLYNKFGLPEKGVRRDVFNALIRSIVAQQLSIKAAATIYSRFVELFDGKPTPLKLLKIEHDTLRQVGLSGQKSSYVHHVARFFLENSLHKTDWNTLSDEEVIQLLTRIKGVGVWTVQMLLIFTLDRPDVFPVDDLGIQTGMKQMYALTTEGKPLKKEIEEIAVNWIPFRSIASKLIWMGKDTI